MQCNAKPTNMWAEKDTACSFSRNRTLLIEFNKGDSYEPEITVLGRNETVLWSV